MTRRAAGSPPLTPVYRGEVAQYADLAAYAAGGHPTAGPDAFPAAHEVLVADVLCHGGTSCLDVVFVRDSVYRALQARWSPGHGYRIAGWRRWADAAALLGDPSLVPEYGPELAACLRTQVVFHLGASPQAAAPNAIPASPAARPPARRSARSRRP